MTGDKELIYLGDSGRYRLESIKKIESLLQQFQDVSYNYKNIIRFANEFIKRCCFKVGEKVKLKYDLSKNLKVGSGWYSYKDMLNPENVGEIIDINFIDENGNVHYNVKWEEQFYIDSNNKEVPLEYKYLFSHIEKDLEKV